MSSVPKKPTVIGGKLKLKGSSSSSSGNKSTSSSTGKVSTKRPLETDNTAAVESDHGTSSNEVYLTESQKRFKLKNIEKEKRDAEKLSKQSFRNRIDEFNQKLSKLSEHNDIPRISAAGNG